MNNYPRLVIAGPRGGIGKTTLSLGIISALRYKKNLRVVPFKKGPDFIDAGWMSVAANNPCYNLDSFLISKERVLGSFLSHFNGDIAVIEGNRGLYDGMDVDGSYSTAEIAKLLNAPVLLIVDCTKMTRTTAALVQGCINFDKDVKIKGIVINQIAGSRHESVVRESIERYCSLPVLGAIPRLNSRDMPERHMGLTPYQEHPDIKNAISFAEGIAEKYIDIDKIFDIAKDAEPLNDSNALGKMCNDSKNGHASLVAHHQVKIGIIRDSAFQFYYPENIEELQKNGAEIVDINALEDTSLPEIDALYIGGGFPETNAIRLAENKKFRESVRSAAEDGLPIYAECGGLMFLGDSIIVEDKRYPMVGVFPIVFHMNKKPQAHGYTVVEVGKDNPFYPVGTVLYGHEFHYSAAVETKENADISAAFKMKRGHGIRNKMDGVFYKNVFGTYTHIHALGAKEWVIGMIKKAKEYRTKRVSS